MSDTPTGETVNTGDTQTTVTTSATPAVNAPDPAEVERLRKESEQKDLRIRQLENERKAREDAEAETKRKQLEENEEYKSLYEREKAERERLANEQADAERKAALNSAQNEIFATFPADVTDVASTAGLSLTDDSEEAKVALKTKLEAIASKVSSTQTVTGNNPSPTAEPTGTDRTKLLQRMRFNDKDLSESAKIEAISKIPALDAMREQAGYTKK